MNRVNRLYPVFIKLEGRPCLVVGGSEIAATRVRVLLDAGARLTVIAPLLVPELRELRDAGRLRWLRRKFRPRDLRGVFLVVVDRSDPEVSRVVFREAEKRGVLTNAIDQDDVSSVHTPAIATRGDIKIAISTNGKSPAFASRLKGEIQERLTGEEARFLAELGRLRPRVLERNAHDPERRSRILGGLVRSFRGRGKSSRNPGGDRARPGTVYLVGAGPGAPALLTARAARLLESADVVFHDRLVGPEILESIPERVERIHVGKEAGKSSFPDTGELLVEAALQGRAVVRLKGGDPNLFGRGGDELLALLRSGVRCEIVPGVSALTAVPAAAGIPVTFRKLSQQLIVRSGYRELLPETARLIAATPRESTFVYFMTVGRLTEIVHELRHGDGLEDDTPIAIIQRGTLPGQQVLRGTLGNLLDLASRTPLRPPALVVAGDVVRFMNPDDLIAFLDREENRKMDRGERSASVTGSSKRRHDA